MIKHDSTLLGVKDSAGVHLEDGLVGLDTDSNWLLDNSGFELGDALWKNILASSNGNLTLSGNILAGPGGSSTSSVWVVSFKLLSVILNIFEGKGGETTTTSFTSFVTGGNLLLGEGEKLLGLDEVS